MCPACDFLVTTTNNVTQDREALKPEPGNRMHSWDFLGRGSEWVCDPPLAEGQGFNPVHPSMGVLTYLSSSICWRFLMVRSPLPFVMEKKEKETVPQDDLAFESRCPNQEEDR